MLLKVDVGRVILYSTYILQIFNFANFANLESFAKFIQLNVEPLCYHTHGQHAFAKVFQRIPSKLLFTKIRLAKYRCYTVVGECVYCSPQYLAGHFTLSYLSQ